MCDTGLVFLHLMFDLKIISYVAASDQFVLKQIQLLFEEPQIKPFISKISST